MSQTPADKLAAVQHDQDRRLKDEYRGRAAKKFMSEVKGSLLFQSNWPDLLSAAPTAFELMGACSVAASAPDANSVLLTGAVPKDGWKCLVNVQPPSLRACLIQITTQGRSAFGTAGVNMSKIAETSSTIEELFRKIISAVQNVSQPGIRDYLENYLEQLRDQAKDFSYYSDEVEKAFDTWLTMVAELHTASEQMPGSVRAETSTNLSAQIAAQILQQGASDVLKNAQDAADRAKKSLDVSKYSFKKANEAIPSPLAAMRMQLLQSVVTAVPKLMAASLPAVMIAADPLAALGPAIGGIGKSLTVGAVQGAPTVAQGAAALMSGPQVLPVGNNDPGYQAALHTEPIVTSLFSYLTQGKDQSIDWDKFHDKADGGDGTNPVGVTAIENWLSMAKKNLSNQEPSIEVSSAIDSSLSVLREIGNAIKQKSQLTAASVGKDTIKGWQDKVKEAETVVTRLSSTLSTAPGASSNTPTVCDMQPPVPSDNSSGCAALDMANKRLATEQEALNNSQKTYETAMEHQTQAISDLAVARGKLAELKATADTLKTHAKAVLISCINVLVQLKVQFGKQKQFFSAICAMIDVVVRTQVNGFDQDIETLGNVSMETGGLTVNNLTQEASRSPVWHEELVLTSIKTIYSSILQLKSYLDLLHDNAEMYRKIHSEHIVPGVDLVDMLSQQRSASEIAQRQRQLEHFADDAASAIKDLCEKQQREVSESLQQRIDNIAQSTQRLQSVGATIDPKAQAAVKAGATTNTQAVQAGFDQYQAIKKKLARDF
ncbi:hypothetical protein MMC11_000882 [Xylographa trunciseda]|nr:hypothetical protein [Xylographa trunciseda]